MTHVYKKGKKEIKVNSVLCWTCCYISDDCSDKVVVGGNISCSANSDIKMGPATRYIYQVNGKWSSRLAVGPSGNFYEILWMFLCEKMAPTQWYSIVVCAEVKKTLAIVIHDATSMLSLSSLPVSVVNSVLGIYPPRPTFLKYFPGRLTKYVLENFSYLTSRFKDKQGNPN